MPTMIITFPAGRYHATPWGHHVNEGLIEWPPSPWRLLRALIATGYAKLGWDDVPPAGRRLIETLAGVLPTYQLPPASAAHSRHYMPVGELNKGVEKTTLVFDTWANVGDGELGVRWECSLDDDAAELFAQLVERLGYVGRSESWVEARVAADDIPFQESRTALPQHNGEYFGPDWEQIPLQAAVAPDTYDQWRDEMTKAALAALPQPKGKPTKAIEKKLAAAVAPYPTDLIACLEKDTAWWKKRHNWSHPPGARRVLYWRPADSLVVAPTQRLRRSESERVEAVLLALSTSSRRKSGLPHVHRTLPQAELIHRSLIAKLHRSNNHSPRVIECPELVGRDENRRALLSNHQHAHILPLDLNGDQHLDHILIWAPMGLGDTAQNAIQSLKRTWTKGGGGDLQLAIVGRGSLDAFRGVLQPILGMPRAQKGQGTDSRSSVWVSLTPFVPPRFVKRSGRNTLEEQLQAELAGRGLPKAQRIEIQAARSLEYRHYIRIRKRGGLQPPIDVGYAVSLEFADPVSGPIALGYASHFGLGLFATAKRQ